MAKGIVLGEGTEEDPAVLLTEPGENRELVDTNLGDSHAPKRQLREHLDKTHEDWGDGFLVQPEPVHIVRDRQGHIVQTIPLSEIPGVEYTSQQEDAAAVVAETKETPVPMSRKERTQMVAILSARLFKYYRARGPGDPRYNPFRDGLPDLPAGSPENLQPLPTTKLYPATDGQIYEWITRFIGERATVVNKGKYGGGIEDMALRIE